MFIQSTILFIIGFFMYYYADEYARRTIKMPYSNENRNEEQIRDKLFIAYKVKDIGGGISFTAIIFLLTLLLIIRDQEEKK